MIKTTLYQYFRSFLIRIALLDGHLGVIPPEWDPTFAVVLEMKDGEIPADPITKVSRMSYIGHCLTCKSLKQRINLP